MGGGRFDHFALAERLCMTVAELETRMSGKEFVEWLAYYAIRNEVPDGGV